jgi:hypothetical protein
MTLGGGSHPQCQPAASHDLASGFTRIAVLLSRGKYTLRAVGFVPVASVQLLISTPAVLSSWFMTSSVAVHPAPSRLRDGSFLESVLADTQVKLRA